MNWIVLAELNWGPIGQWVAAAVTFAVLCYAVFNDAVPRPILKVDFDNKLDRTAYTKEGKSRLSEKHEFQDDAMWLRVRVENDKFWNRVARNCRAYLVSASIEKIERQEDGSEKVQWIDVLENDVRPLRWMHDHDEKPQGRDLLPGVVSRVDIAVTFGGKDRIALCVFPDWTISSGVHVLRIQVAAEGARPVEMTLRVMWDGKDWSTLDATMEKPRQSASRLIQFARAFGWRK
jgi:hypothetical protein